MEHQTSHIFQITLSHNISVFGKFHQTNTFFKLFVSVFLSLGNFIRLVTLFVISLNCSQFMWESFGMATFSCFPLQVHGEFHEYGGKGLQLDQWAPPFCSHWPTTSPPLIFPGWFCDGIEVHPVWESLLVGADCQSWSLICIVLYSELVGRDMSTHSMWEKYGYHIKLVTFFKLLTVISVFRSLGNFIRLVTLFIISLNCSQFMWESLGMATFSCFLL